MSNECFRQEAMTERERAAGLKEGKRLFNSGMFFEAHETWEGVWKETGGKNKKILQGLIQAAAGFHTFKQGSIIGAVRLINRSAEKLLQAPQYQSLANQLLNCIQAMETGTFDESKIPKLKLSFIK